MKERCDSCKWFEPGKVLGGVPGGTCMFNPPAAIPVPTGEVRESMPVLSVLPVLPPVAAHGRCSHHVIALARTN